MKTDKCGLPLAFDITSGAANDAPLMPKWIAAGPEIQPHAMIADKSYDSAKNRAAARHVRAIPVIAYRKHRLNRPKRFATVLYRARARMEITMGKLKCFKCIAMRCEKTARNFRSMIAFVLGTVIIKSVHTA